MSLGDGNTISYKIISRCFYPILVEVIDDFPDQFQARNFSVFKNIKPFGELNYKLELTPNTRGLYPFGPIYLYIQSPLRLVQKKEIHYETLDNNKQKQKELENLIKQYKNSELTDFTKVYPSFMQMRKYELITQTYIKDEAGSTAIRKVGASMEFEQIKDYVIGDDIRNINWKATARKGDLMVNHYMEEKSQQVYCIIDKSRLMKMPFNGISLMDYAINSTLVLASAVLRKNDRIGLISFSNKKNDTMIIADRRPNQLSKISEKLYAETTDFLEADYERLYTNIRRYVKNRSLLMLFTNIESLSGLKRNLPYFRLLAKRHLLVLVFFENSTIEQIAMMDVQNKEQLYLKTIANKFAYEKRLIAKELQKHGINVLLTSPENLTINALNKYLEIKSKQIL